MHLQVTALVLLSAWAMCAGGVLPFARIPVGRLQRSPDSPENDLPVKGPSPNDEITVDPMQAKAGEQPGPDLSSLIPNMVPSLMNNTLFNERSTMVAGAFTMMFMPMPAGSDMVNMFQNGFSMFPSIPGVSSIPGLSGRR
ncbi:uncharacterized protein LOC134530325 isoform X2 [Bacillus rossius redtenbacheri]|uniref:uncharacterized protein LOC134530325 isoform X2 n=1 Tax=Bacillus rossius redtenbacheri TaxID=93214 RepID=UPI002FDD64ED